MNGIRKKTILILSLLTVNTALINAQADVVKLDRQKCRLMALDYSRKLQQSENQKEQSLLRERIARAAMFPEFSASGLYFYSPDDMGYSFEPTSFLDLDFLSPGIISEILSGLELNIDDILPDLKLNIGLEGVTMASVDMEQAVYMGGRVRTAIRMAETGTDMANLNIERNRSEIIALADSAFFLYVSVREQKETALQYKRLLDELVDKIKDSMEEGMATRNDLLKAMVRQNEAILMVRKARSGLQLAQMNLCRITGLPLETEISVEERPEAEVTDLSILLKYEDNPQQRPEYKMLEKAVELSEYEKHMTRAEMFPQLGIRAGYNYFGGLEINRQSVDDRYISVMGSVRIPIFNWNEKRNRLSKVRLKTETAELEKEDIEKLLQMEIARARLMLEDALTRLELTEVALKHAEENLETSSDRFDEGMETLVNLLEAQAQWQEACSDHTDARISVRLNKNYYLKAIGKLTAYP